MEANNLDRRYQDGTYLQDNPDWHRQDAPWKAGLIQRILSDFNINPSSACEVGCGSGDVLVHLSLACPHTKFHGFDISPQAEAFWSRHDARTSEEIIFRRGDFHAINTSKHDVLLMLDVFEHVRDPFTFLEKTRPHASYFVFHIPLDISASSVLRVHPLLTARRRLGHLHYYTKDLALEILRDCGYEIMEWRYTGASLNSPNRSWKTRLASLPRRLAYAVNKDFGVRLLGGETLLVLARSADQKT